MGGRVCGGMKGKRRRRAPLSLSLALLLVFPRRPLTTSPWEAILVPKKKIVIYTAGWCNLTKLGGIRDMCYFVFSLFPIA